MTDDTKKPTIGFKTPEVERSEILQAKNDNLQIQLAQAQKRIRELEIEVDGLQKKQIHDTPLRSDNDHKILELLAKQPNIPVEQIAQTLGRNIEQIRYELGELSKIGFINCQMTPYSIFSHRSPKPIAVWNLTHDGRGYMIKHSLLK